MQIPRMITKKIEAELDVSENSWLCNAISPQLINYIHKILCVQYKFLEELRMRVTS